MRDHFLWVCDPKTDLYCSENIIYVPLFCKITGFYVGGGPASCHDPEQPCNGPPASKQSSSPFALSNVLFAK